MSSPQAAGSNPLPNRGHHHPSAQAKLPELREYAQIMAHVNDGLRAFISEMTTVFRFIETVSAVHALDRIVALLLDVLKELCAFEAAALYLAPEAGERPELIKAVQLPRIERYRKKLEIDERIYNWVYRQGHAVIIPESYSRKKRASEKSWSFMIAPLATESDRYGRIEMLFSRPQGAFTQQTFSILNVLLKHALVIIINERVYEKERRTVQKYLELDMLKKDVVNTTTHEIRTPLTVIQAASILLEQDKNMPDSARVELYKKITAQCGRINQIVGELFETSQLEDGHPHLTPENISLTELTNEVMRDLYFDPAAVSFQLDFPPELKQVRADRSSLYKILHNLMENAIKYSLPGGGIVIVISACNLEHAVEWRVKDQGIGISPEDQGKIFDKFFRAGSSTTRRVRGLGLGLYIVKQNVELNGGSITVTSEPQAGSTFILSLPQA